MNNAMRAILLSAWSPAKLFQPSDLGCWLDPGEFSSMWQESNGVTATTNGDAVGLLTDRRYAYARGSDLVANGSFASDTAWTKEAGWSIAGGVAVATAAASGTSVYQAIDSTDGRWYEVTFTVSGYSAGGCYATLFDAVDGPTVTANGTYTCRLKRNGALALVGIAAGASGFTGNVDNVSVREILGSHASQGTAGNRPLLAAGGKIDYDGVNDALVVTFPSDMGTACTVGRSVPQGEATILTGQTITTTYTDSTDHCGLVIINRALTATETNQLRRWLNRRAG